MSLFIEVVHIRMLKNGDTVEIDGEFETVSGKNIKHCHFMGWTYKGDPFLNGIKKVTFIVKTANGVRYE